MAYPPNPADRPDPMDNAPPMRARVPDHVASGQISTGVIVVTGATEFILDFVRNLPRPNMIVARVVLPHQVMPQFIEALSTNIGLYRQRFNDLNLPSSSSNAIQSFTEQNPVPFPPASPYGPTSANEPSASPRSDPSTESIFGNPIDIHPGSTLPDQYSKQHPSSKPDSSLPPVEKSKDSSGNPSGSNREEENVVENQPSEDSEKLKPKEPTQPSITRHPSPQEVYDDLKLKDELLSGAYSNAVMIGHGPHEFSFDFITNFYPQSAVSCRVFMAAGHVGRLLESLRASWDQLRSRMG